MTEVTHLNPGERVDWFRMFADLKRNGWSVWNIAEQTGLPRERLRGWQNNGHEPKHTDGEAFIAFYCVAMGRHRAELPVMRLELSAAKAR